MFLLLDALPLAEKKENGAIPTTEVITTLSPELITSEISKPFDSTTAIAIESTAEPTEITIQNTVEPEQSSVEPLEFEITVQSTIEPVQDTVEPEETTVTQMTVEKENTTTVEVFSSPESMTTEVDIPANNSMPAEVIKDKLSEQIRKILKHYQKPEPEGFPGAPIPDPLSIPPMKKEFGLADMTFTNMTVHGLSKFKVERVETDLKKMEVRMFFCENNLHFV